MAVKVLVNAVGQHIVAEVKQVENKETGEMVAYWLENPRLVSYVPRPEEEGGGITVQFGTLCPLSDEQAFSVRSEHIVSILEPRDDVVSSYNDVVAPAQAEAQVNIDGEGDESGSDTVEDGTKPGLTD
jgi:hypothetical protein